MSAPLTLAQAARILGVSERTLRRRVASGQIEAVKSSSPATGKAWFIEQATLDALLASGAEGNESSAETELATLARDVAEIKAFLLPCDTGEQEKSATLAFDVTLREALAPLVEHFCAQNARLQERVAELEAREAAPRRLRWRFWKR